jgi:hypothetical protein
VGKNEMVAFEYGIPLLTSSVQPVVLTSHCGYRRPIRKER